MTDELKAVRGKDDGDDAGTDRDNTMVGINLDTTLPMLPDSDSDWDTFFRRFT